MKAIGLIDVRCMYVSCERFVDPRLKSKPVVVLSNNDGCVISRSDEAKRCGVAMGAPWYKVRNDPRFSRVVARSSNYELYGDMSVRFHRAIASMSAWSEVYSIDESFMALDRSAGDHAAAIQERVHAWTRLPTSAGVGPTKTLAKVAQRHAKETGASLCDVTGWPRPRLDDLLAATPVNAVWGVGWRLSRQLAGRGVESALDLARLDPGVVRRRWSVVLERTVRELRGVSCIELGHEPQPKHQIVYSRMMSAPVTTRAEMEHVVAQHAWMASRRLRQGGQTASLVQVWMSTSYFRDDTRRDGACVSLSPPTNDPAHLIKAAKAVVATMHEGAPYNRVGVLLAGLAPAGEQATLFGEDSDDLNRAVDEINARFGHGAIGPGVTGMRGRQRWDMRRDMLSPASTTRWDDLIVVRAGWQQ